MSIREILDSNRVLIDILEEIIEDLDANMENDPETIEMEEIKNEMDKH